MSRIRGRLAVAVGALITALLLMGFSPSASAAKPTKPAAASADVSVSVIDSADPHVTEYLIDEGISYTATIANAGPSTASAGTITFTVPSTGIVSSAPGCTSNFDLALKQTTVRCPVGDLAPSATAARTIQVEWQPCQSDTGQATYSLVAQGSSSTKDPSLSNNSETETTSVFIVDGGSPFCVGTAG